MSTPDPESMGLLGKVLAAATAVVVPVWGARTWIENRFSRKMDKSDFKDFMERFDKHCENDREVQAKLFDRVDEVKNILIEKLPR
jgi:hypothetical protein